MVQVKAVVWNLISVQTAMRLKVWRDITTSTMVIVSIGMGMGMGVVVHTAMLMEIHTMMWVE